MDDISNEITYNICERTSLLTVSELIQIQRDISTTVRPTWYEGPPSTLGDRGHGKLKADQWRSCIEFDLPVSLAHLLLKAQEEGRADDVKRLESVYRGTMYLASAVQWATSHRTSDRHVQKYVSTMTAYLSSIRNLRPDLDLLPNHHNALHVPRFLKEFGPMHGWWMYPFERINGILQDMPSNSRLGG